MRRRFNPEADAVDYWRARARFCLATGVQPDQYDDMTPAEIAVWVEEVNRASK